MKHLIFISLLFVLAFGINDESFAQEDQGGGLGIGLRSLRGGAMYPQQMNSAGLKKNRRIKSAGTLRGIRHLVPQDYATIQAAIDASTDGDTVLVSDGTYVENIRFYGKAIVVASLFLIDEDTTHIEQTIIDGSNPSHPDSASVVYFIDGEDTTSVLCGFTVTGGAGTTWTNQVMWRSGGGVFCVGAFGATIIDNHITKNRVSGENTSGGGLEFFADQGFLILERNRIFGNHVSTITASGYGGGADIWGDEVYARIVDNVFEKDTVVAQSYAIGGAVYLGGGASTAGAMIRGNVFRESIADAATGNGLGGGVFTWNTLAMEVRDNVFEDNIAKSSNATAEGGALLIDDEPPASGYGSKMVTGNRFVNNLSSSQFGNASGGAIELFRTIATIDGNYFSDNTADGATGSYGGALGLRYSAFHLENNIVRNNSAPLGAGVYVNQPPDSGTGQALINNTIADNNGAGIRLFSTGLTVLNTILWGNSGGAFQISGGTLDVTYSNVQGSNIWPGMGNINTAPYFVDDIDYQLSDSSFCIGAGTTPCPPFDFHGNPRPDPLGSLPDIGACESPLADPEGIIRVPSGYSTIQAGIDAAADGNTVLVADGTYLENINFKGKAITVASHYIMDGDTNHIANTIIDGSQPSDPDSGSVVYFISGEDTNSVLYGFTITGGTGTPNGQTSGAGGILCLAGASIYWNRIVNNVVEFDGPYALGGGIFANIFYTIIENNEIVGNSVQADNVWGGGMYTSGDARIINNRVENNMLKALNGTTSGGGIGSQTNSTGAAHVLIKNNIIRGNTSQSLSSASGCYGGGLDIYYPTVELIGNRIELNTTSSIPFAHAAGFRVIFTGEESVINGNIVKDNQDVGTTSSAYAGGIAIYYCRPLVTNNIVTQNRADYGSGIYVVASSNSFVPEETRSMDGGLSPLAEKISAQRNSAEQFLAMPTMINNTIVSNHGGWGIRASNANVNVLSSILWGNPSGQINLIGSGSAEVHYSDIQGGWPGDGNIDEDPSFADTINYQLSDSSRCIGAGVDSVDIGGTWYHAPTADIAGNPRPNPSGSMPDMGAWESPLALPVGIQPPYAGELPIAYALDRSYPNPFNPSTTIAYQVPRQSDVRIEIYNMLGQRVRTLLNDRKKPGSYQVIWDGRNDSSAQVGSGVYLYRMIAMDPSTGSGQRFVQTRKMILLK